MEFYLHGNKEHPFLFDRLRLNPDGSVSHVNSIFKNYNDDGEVKNETEHNRRKYIVCKSKQEMEERIKTTELKENQTLYIIAKFRGGGGRNDIIKKIG